MCSIGRHQLEDDIPAPRIRRPAGARTISRKQLQEAVAKTRRALEEETGRLDPAQAAAQEQFALNFEPIPPGQDMIPEEGIPDEEIPYYARMP